MFSKKNKKLDIHKIRKRKEISKLFRNLIRIFTNKNLSIQLIGAIR